MVSVSTKLATFPSSSMPRELNRVPARRQDSRDIKAKVEGRPLLRALRGEDDVGIVMEETNPRMADVKIRDWSSNSLSCAAKRERNLMRGSIIYEFHRKPSSRLSTSKADSSDVLRALDFVQSRLNRRSYLSCKRLVRSKSTL